MHAASGPYHRELRVPEQPRRAADQVRIGRWLPVDLRLRELYLLLRGQSRPWRLEQHGAGAAVLHPPHRLLNGGGNFGGALDPARPPGQRLEPPGLVRPLVAEVAVAGDNEHGGREIVGGCHAGQGVECAGAGNDDGRRDTPSGPRVAVGHVGGGLFVAYGDVAYLGSLPKSVDGLVLARSGNAEHGAHALAQHRPRQRLAAGHSSHGSLARRRPAGARSAAPSSRTEQSLIAAGDGPPRRSPPSG